MDRGPRNVSVGESNIRSGLNIGGRSGAVVLTDIDVECEDVQGLAPLSEFINSRLPTTMQ